jgi:hypothetical protein
MEWRQHGWRDVGWKVALKKQGGFMAFAGIQKFIGRLEMQLLTKPKKTAPITASPRRNESVPALYESLVELHCVCAVTDKAYVLQYRRSANGKLHYLKSEKCDGTIPPGRNTGGASASAAQEVTLDAFDALRFPCPWCGDATVNSCSCGSLVCGGRKRGNLFVCRASCGETWTGVPLKKVETSTRRKPAAQCSTAPPRPAASAVTALALRHGPAGLKKR